MASFVTVKEFETVAVVDVNVVTTPVTAYKLLDASTIAPSTSPTNLEPVTIPLNVAEVPPVKIPTVLIQVIITPLGNLGASPALLV